MKKKYFLGKVNITCWKNTLFSSCYPLCALHGVEKSYFFFIKSSREKENMFNDVIAFKSSRVCGQLALPNMNTLRIVLIFLTLKKILNIAESQLSIP